MRKLVICLLALGLSQAVQAQTGQSSGRNFKRFKVDIDFGYASPQGTPPQSTGPQGANGGYNFNGGALFAIEPKFAIVDRLAIGVRAEGAVTAHVNTNSNGGSDNGSGQVNLSYLLTMDFYILNGGFRPFIGGGAGIYTTAVVDSTTSNYSASDIPRTSQFGYMARVGFEVGHLRVGAEYNFVANNASYLGLKIGIGIGGGRKR